MRLDSRIRLLRKSNGGVASARNAGIAASTGDFVAFIDADDLWHPAKLARQVPVLEAGGPEMGLVYAPFRSIDAEGRVLGSSWNHRADGWVPFRHFHMNLVGNGSAILVRRSVLDELGGYATWLRDAGAEGCEDLLLQLRIALRYRFGVVPDYLVGYRRHPGSMSENREAMARSGILAVEAAFAEARNVPGLSMRHLLADYERALIKAAWRNRHFGRFARSALRQLGTDPAGTARVLRHARSAPPPPAAAPGRHFHDYRPDEAMATEDPVLAPAFAVLARLDALYRPAPPRHGPARTGGQDRIVPAGPLTLATLPSGLPPGETPTLQR